MAIGIYCCKNCVPPKRHLNCHATCKEYIDAKAQFEENKKKFKADIAKIPNLTAYDSDEIDFRRKYDKRNYKRKRN